LLLNLLLLAAGVSAQRLDVTEWPAATVVSTSGDTVSGKVTYYRADDILEITLPDGKTTTLTPVLVQGFTVPAGGGHPDQKFRTYLWNRGNDYSTFKAPAFFEQLTTGNVSLLKREILRQNVVRNDPFYNPMYGGMGYGGFGGPGGLYNTPYWVTNVQELFYLQTAQGKIVQLRNPKKDILYYLSDKQKQIKAYVKENDLRYNRKYDLIRIVQFYNSLGSPAAKSAN
jgi:hypothetical protein